MKFKEPLMNRLQKLETPFIIYDLKLIRKKYLQLKKNFPNFKVFYAMKANSHPRITKLLNQLNSGFEVASLGETKQLLSQQVSSEKIICMHPIKSPSFLSFLQKNKIRVLAVDSYEEVAKIARFAPHSLIVIRLEVDNEGSGWNLSRKFGVTVSEAPKLLAYIKGLGLKPHGITFHVGSQCLNLSNWKSAIKESAKIWSIAESMGIRMKFLSIGGGMPIQNKTSVPKLAEVGSWVSRAVKKNFNDKKDVEFIMEPGRYMVSESGMLVCEIIGALRRGNKDWLYIDVGTYNGLIEAIETPDRNFYPLVVTNNSRIKKNYNIGGPSCVGLDVPFEDVKLPEMKVGERIYIQFAGAYTVACGASFNGFPVPKEHFLES